MEGTAMFREPVCQRNRFKKKLFTMLPWKGCTVQAKASMIMVSLVGKQQISLHILFLMFLFVLCTPNFCCVVVV